MTPRCKPSSCDGCIIKSHGTDFSHVEGTCANGVMIVGEASGEHEQRDQLPFRPYAPAGSLLERTFRRMGVNREQFAITNIVRCRPRNNWLEGSPWEYSSIRECRPNLDAAIAKYRPRVIVALGGIATRELTGMAGEAQGIGHLCGYVLPGPNAVPVVPDFHPAFLRRGKASHQGLFARVLHRALQVASGRDHSWIWNIDPEDPTTHANAHTRVTYLTRPSLDDAIAYRNRILGNSGLPVIYDLETFESASLDEDAREGFTDTQIRLIQFSVGAGEGIAFPWEGEYRRVAGEILRSSNLKAGHNLWLFDNKVLRAESERSGEDLNPRGPIHDTLQMFHHWQPDLPAHLQFAAQFVGFPFPWKHLAGTNLEFYGCADVDATGRLYTFLGAKLMQDGIWGDEIRGYLGQMYHVRPVLERMEQRGMPIDDAKRLALGEEFNAAQRELGEEISKRAGDIGRVHPKEGYKGTPPEVKKWFTENGVPAVFSEFYSVRFTEEATEARPAEECESYRYEMRPFDTAGVDEAGEPTTVVQQRWCRVYDFNPNSALQLLAYMRAHGHKIPKSRKNEDEEGNPKDTTEKKELQRLARKHGDDFYLKVIEYRELSKAKGTYVDGFAPHADGCVHTTFTFDTGTGQLTSRNPNAQNFLKHGRLAKATRAMCAPRAGHVLVEADYKAYHVLTTGFEAECAPYMRLARLDMHSFIAGVFLKHWGIELMEESDAALLDRFAWFKSDPKRKYVRDKQAKPSILGVGFGMKKRRLYHENLEHYKSEAEAGRFLAILQEAFRPVFDWQERIQKLAHEQQYLKSRFGHIRRFYEVFRWDSKKNAWGHGDQAEEAVAFLPANHAFGNIRECMKDQRQRGFDEKYGLFNNIHDSFLYHFPERMLDEFLCEVPPVLMAPSKVLTHPTLAPEGLWAEVEVAVGRKDWSEMKNVELTTGAIA